MRSAIAETPWFRFHSDLRFNVYDALLTSAAARRRNEPDPSHDGCFSALVLEERVAWDAAVAYFAQTVATTSDFSRERLVVRTRLAGFEPRLNEDDRRDLRLALLFHEAATPAYLGCRWAEQDKANRRWVAEVVPILQRHGEAVRRRLEALFGAAWRQLPIDVDLVATAGWAGADTIASPTHIQMS